jgi:hypothetical protein
MPKRGCIWCTLARSRVAWSMRNTRADSELAPERALSAAKKIEVGLNGLQNVTLEVTDPR